MLAKMFITSPRAFTTLRCSFHASAFLKKQPAHDRQRRRRKFIPPFHGNLFYDEDPIKELKATDLFSKEPCGRWGSTDSRLKKKFSKTAATLESLPSLFAKLDELYYHEDNMWYQNLCLPLKFPESLEFSQHLTRSIMYPLSSLGILQKSTEQPVLDDLQWFLVSELHMLNRRFRNKLDISKMAKQQRIDDRQEFICNLMEHIYISLVRHHRSSHLLTGFNQIDNGAKVETFFKRAGYVNLLTPKPEEENLAEGLWEPVDETCIDSDGLLRFRLRSQLAWQLRGRNPLSSFVPLEDSACYSGDLPRDLFRPEQFGLQPVECYEFSCLPFVRNKISSEYLRSVAGYWTDTPFFKGDPCQFGLVGVLDVARNEDLFTDLESSSVLTHSEKANIVSRHGLSEGLLTAFGWASAIAYNQGFNIYNDLTYPISVQLLLTDGHYFQLLNFQLNSLTALWKSEDAGLPYNVAWFSERMPLYEAAFVDQTRIEVNRATLSMITTCLLREPSCDIDEKILRPYLVPQDSCERLIPFADSMTESSSLEQDPNDGTASGARLTRAEHEALIAFEGSKGKKLPMRIRARAQPHPNDIFFFRPTEKEDLIKEFREEMPVFGGPRIRLPTSANEVLQDYNAKMRVRLPHRKALRGPRRWR